ncbi:putative Short-chain dehydrogenase/reductase SDR [Mesorhizobium sp. SOD10]|nr:putative Short-chain dehydrogenase/reductase SDR [Mesorhizobium sp. SOD10]
MTNQNYQTTKVAVIVGATSKWQSDGSRTVSLAGGKISDADVPLGIRWGIGGAIAQKFAAEGYTVVLTTRHRDNAAALAAAISDQGGRAIIAELDLTSRESIAEAFEMIRKQAGEPEVVIYNAGYASGRELPPEKELIENLPDEVFETAIDIACRGPYLVAKEILPAMRKSGNGSYFLTNNHNSLHGTKRKTGESLYYPRVMMRTLAQVLTEEYSPLGVHIANIVVDGMIDSPGTRAHGEAMYKDTGEIMLDPTRIAEAYYYLHTQHPSCWTHEVQLTPYNRPVTR